MEVNANRQRTTLMVKAKEAKRESDKNQGKTRDDRQAICSSVSKSVPPLTQYVFPLTGLEVQNQHQSTKAVIKQDLHTYLIQPSVKSAFITALRSEAELLGLAGILTVGSALDNSQTASSSHVVLSFQKRLHQLHHLETLDEGMLCTFT